MALKQVEVTVEAEGGDRGKRFQITRMDAITADKWGRHVIQAAIKSGASIPESAIAIGMRGVAELGIRIFGGMDTEVADQLIQQLLDQVKSMPDPSNPHVTVPLLPSQIEEADTIAFLYSEAFDLHLGFIIAAAKPLSPLVAALLRAIAADMLPQETSPP